MRSGPGDPQFVGRQREASDPPPRPCPWPRPCERLCRRPAARMGGARGPGWSPGRCVRTAWALRSAEPFRGTRISASSACHAAPWLTPGKERKPARSFGSVGRDARWGLGSAGVPVCWGVMPAGVRFHGKFGSLRRGAGRGFRFRGELRFVGARRPHGVVFPGQLQFRWQRCRGWSHSARSDAAGFWFCRGVLGPGSDSR